MTNSRQDQAISFAALALFTGLLFGAVAWVAGVVATRTATETQARELAVRQGLIARRADGVARFIRTTYVEKGEADRVTTVRRRFGPEGDRLDVIHEVLQRFLEEVDRDSVLSDSVLAVLPDYLLLYSTDDIPVFISFDLARLWSDTVANQSSPYRAFLAETGPLEHIASITPEEGHTVREFFGKKIVFIAARESSGRTRISKVIAGTSFPETNYGFERVAGALAIVAPIAAVIALYGGYRIAGRPLMPVERMINEVEAITDGRSLHKRVAVDHGFSELNRLGTTLNAMMERLETSFVALRTFTADASHELNTPLAVLRADVERAMDPRVQQNERLVALEEALREIRRMTDLVDDLLTLARADEGRVELDREPVDMAALVRDVHETALLLAEDRGLKVSLTMLEEATVIGDEERLRQLFMNLITNAIKYTPDGGAVELSLSIRLDGVAFAVRDTGIGISAADLPFIFDRFWRADHVRSRESVSAGFGLGLPICYWIAQAHGGSLTASSKLGKGSTFTVTLPLPGDGAASPTQGLRSASTHSEDDA